MHVKRTHMGRGKKNYTETFLKDLLCVPYYVNLVPYREGRFTDRQNLLEEEKEKEEEKEEDKGSEEEIKGKRRGRKKSRKENYLRSIERRRRARKEEVDG